MLSAFVFIGGAAVGLMAGGILAQILWLSLADEDDPGAFLQLCTILWFIGAAVAGGIATLALV